MLVRSCHTNVVLNQGWLSTTPPDFQKRVLAASQHCAFNAGASIYSAGDAPGGIFGLLKGKLGVSIVPNETGPYLSHFMRLGDWVGEGSALTGLPRKVGVTAVGHTEVLHLPLHAIEQITADDPVTWRYFALLAVVIFDITVGAVDDLRLRDDTKRCVAVLLRLANCRSASSADGEPIEVDVNQSDLAALANLSRNTAGAIIRKLEAKGLIALSYRRIAILNAEDLREMLKD